MLYFPLDSGKKTIDGLVDTGALTCAISQADLRKNGLLAPQASLNEGQSPDFQLMVANGHLETRSAAVQLQIEVGNILFHERFIVIPIS